MKWDNLKQVLQEYTTAIERGLLTKIPSTYEIRNNIRVDFSINDTNYEVTFNAPSYWQYIENGRKAGKMPPLTAIEQWIEKKRITPRQTSKTPSKTSLAFLIARKIGRDGIEGKHYLNDTLTSLSDFEKRISDAITKDVETELDTFLVSDTPQNKS